MLKIILVLLSLNTYAYLDLSMGVAARSYPSIGGELYAESGYNQLLWGEGNKKNPLYGFIRPNVRVATSAVINSYRAAVEFYPISFIGIVAGKESIKSSFDEFPFYDCTQVHCKGTIDRNFVTYKMALGYAGIIATAEVTQNRNEYSKDSSKQFAEFRFATLANSPKDNHYLSRYVLGYKLEKGLIGVLKEYARFEKSLQTYDMNLLIYVTKNETSSFTYGIGNFKSTHQDSGFIAVFRYNFSFKDSLKIF